MNLARSCGTARKTGGVWLEIAEIPATINTRPSLTQDFLELGNACTLLADRIN
jgi:hypothetical protein